MQSFNQKKVFTHFHSLLMSKKPHAWYAELGYIL